MKRSRINPISSKRSAINTKRKKFRQELLTYRIMCEARIRGCTMIPTDVHEILTRARAGSTEESLLNPNNCLVLCRNCHQFITENPTFAKEFGFVVSWSVTLDADLLSAKRARQEFVYGVGHSDIEDFDESENEW